MDAWALRVGLATAAAVTFGCAVQAAANEVAFGQHLAGECVTCHRADGQDKGIPAIIGWPTDQFIAVLKSYQTKERSNQVMQTITSRLTDDEMRALAAYYQALKPASATSPPVKN